MREARAAQRYESVFGRKPEVEASAPGRVNLIGEHTDYNGGFVLPMALALHTRVLLARRADRRARVASTTIDGASVVHHYELGAEAPGRSWTDYVQGVTWALGADGVRLAGFDALVDSDLPIGAGLASSAALEVALLRALRAGFDLSFDDVALARTGQRAEHGFVGANVGIMDQMAAVLADEQTALLLDTRTLAFERVPWPDGVELVVIDSGIRHAHASGDYNTRRAECERACALLGVDQLRDVSVDELARVERLPEPLNRRARHVLTENERVLAAVEALRTGDVKRLGELFRASHESMRDDYEVSIPAIDALVACAEADARLLGARLTGGGFGGCIIALAEAGAAAAVGERVVRASKLPTARCLLPSRESSETRDVRYR